MKKVLSLGLAAAMMTSTAFAAQLSSKNIVPGTEIKVAMGEFSDPNSLYIGGKLNENSDNAAAALDKAIIANGYGISTASSSTTPVKVTYYAGVNKELGAAWVTETVYAGTNANGFVLHTTPGKAAAGSALESTQANIDAAKKAIDMVARQNIQGYDFTAQNFRATLKAAKGQNLVKSVTFDGTGNLVITFKDDYRLPSSNKAPDFVLTELSVQSIRDIKNPAGNETVLYRNRKFVADIKTVAKGAFDNTDTNNPVTVGVVTNEVVLYGNNEHTLTGDGSWEKFTNGDAYRANVKYDDNSLTVTGTVYSGDVTSFKLGSDLPQPVINVLQNNPNARIDVYPIIAKGFKTGFTVAIKPTLVAGAAADANGNVEVLAALAANNKKIYTVSNTGVVTPAAFTYNAMTGNWEGRIPATGATLLVSDVALLGVTAAAPGTTITNPGTGLGLDLAAAIVK